MTTTETAVQPAAGSHPYPDLTVLPKGWTANLAATYEAMAAADRAAFDEWEIAARSRVFPQPGRHAKPPSVAAVADSPARALTVPDALPVPLAPPAAAVPDLPRRRPSVFARHLRRDRAPEGRNGTLAPPVPAGDEAPTILPGSMKPPSAADDAAAAAVQQQSNEALRRAGAKPADLAHLARPGDGRDATTEMTAVTERPADTGDLK